MASTFDEFITNDPKQKALFDKEYEAEESRCRAPEKTHIGK